MAEMTTVLTEAISQSAGSRAWTYSGNAYDKQRRVVQKSSPAVRVGDIATDSVRVISGTSDDNGDPMAGLVSCEMLFRRPAGGQVADIDAVAAIIVDFVNSDAFRRVFDNQGMIQL
jgi:hypothetical protein